MVDKSDAYSRIANQKSRQTAQPDDDGVLLCSDLTEPSGLPTLKVVHRETNEVVGTVDVSDRTPREVEKIMLGMMRNMSDDYFINDSDAAPSSPTHGGIDG